MTQSKLYTARRTFIGNFEDEIDQMLDEENQRTPSTSTTLDSRNASSAVTRRSIIWLGGLILTLACAACMSYPLLTMSVFVNNGRAIFKFPDYITAAQSVSISEMRRYLAQRILFIMESIQVNDFLPWAYAHVSNK